jgi:ABC-type Fe3+-hydroxamate transport system substrate-binding protein
MPSHRPRTLLAFSDFGGTDSVEQIYAFGSSCIHSELLEIAGADNVVADSRPSVTLSREAVIRLDPELIIELSAGGPTNHWENLTSVNAVRHHRVYVLDDPYTTIPSPGCLMRTLVDFSRIIRENNSGVNE